MQAMWSGGSAVPRSALPSFVQTTMPPVSAIAKLTPGDSGLRGEELLAQVRARDLGERGRIVERPAALPSSRVEELADLFRLEVDRRQHDVARRLAAQLHDPLAEVGVDDLDAVRARGSGLRPHSSVSIDLLFTTRVTPRAASSSSTIWLCSAASRAQCTRAPRAVAAASNCSR